jgi:triphosphoribosyl-dephospho-CoA synthase
VTGFSTPPPADVAAAAQLAAILEASAPKPGNVSPGRPFHDMRYEDFVASAIAIGPAIARAAVRPLGATIRDAIERTRRVTSANTNLGIVLLFAPLARAALSSGGSLRERLARVLAETTVADAAETYAAIRLASPGGLGRGGSQDVASEPTVTLRDAMALAAGRDLVAREYVTDFALTFETGAPALRAARRQRLTWEAATVEAFLALLAAEPDSHVARKLGAAAAEQVTREAAAVRDAGGVRTAEGRERLAALDRDLRDGRNARNPGTTADLTAAALLVVILDDGWTPSGA